MDWHQYAKHRDRISSSSGGWTINGKSTLHGFDTHHELTPNASWIQTLALAITGHLYSKNEARLIEAMYVVTGYADPRIWCNRVVALAGSSRVPAAHSLAAGIASAEAKLYGWQATFHAARVIQRAQQINKEHGESDLIDYVKEIITNDRALPGFGRPLTGVEERIAPLDKMAAELGVEVGPHLQVSRLIEELLKNKCLFMNYGGYVAARLLDMGFDPVSVYRISILAFFTGLVPCYIEAFENEPGTFLPIACEDILYEGREERPLPE